jgi:hypothetical protein
VLPHSSESSHAHSFLSPQQHKKTVLAGCNIVFSGLFPLHGARKPQNERLWRLAVRLGATVSLTMDNFPMTHLVIHPGRLDTAKHNQAKTMPGVVVVVPEWMQKSEQIWKRAPESEFLADTWSAKLARHEADKKATAEAAAAARVVPPSDTEGQNAVGETTPTESTVNRDDGTEEKSGGGDDSATVPVNAPTAPISNKPPPVSILMKESRVVTVGDTDMDKEKLPDTEKKKAVTFSAEVDEAEAQRARELAAQEASASAEANGFLRSSRGPANGPRRPLRRVIGGRSIPLSARPPPENKGLVASGGTFDFLSKISQLGANKRDQKPSASTSPAPSVTTAVSSNPPPTVAAKEPVKVCSQFFGLFAETEVGNDVCFMYRTSMTRSCGSSKPKKKRRPTSKSGNVARRASKTNSRTDGLSERRPRRPHVHRNCQQVLLPRWMWTTKKRLRTATYVVVVSITWWSFLSCTDVLWCCWCMQLDDLEADILDAL